MSRDAVSSSPPARRALGSRWSTKLALAGFGLVVGLALAEVAARVLGLGPHVDVMFREDYRLSRDRALGYELVPGARDGDEFISSAGLRDREYTVPKPAGVFRIAVVGDSIAYGFGLPRSDALPQQLEDVLADYHSRRVSRFEVLNFGVSGYNIDQVVETVRTRVSRFQPDLIVYAYCLNDPQTDSIEYERLRSANAHAAFAGVRHVLSHSQLMRWLFSATQPSDAQWVAVANGSYVDYFEQLYRGASGERLTHGVAALADAARALQVPMAALVYPVFLDSGHYRLGALHARVVSRLSAVGIRAYDLQPLYGAMFHDHGQVFVLNPLHPNALGQRLAALFTAHALADDHLLPPALQPWAAKGELRQLDELLEPIVARVRAANH